MKTFWILLLCGTWLSCKKESSPAPTPPEYERISNLAYGPDAEQKLDLYLPSPRTVNTKTILLVHGGGWVIGDKSDFDAFVPVIQEKLPGYAIANMNYHLATATANHFPTQEMDMKKAVEFLVQKSAEYGISDDLVLLGASAGGHLAVLQAYKYPSPDIKAVVNFFGPSDMVALYHSLTDPFNRSVVENLMGGTPDTNPQLYQQSSPIQFVTGQSPPTLLFHGSSDDLVPVSQSHSLKSRLEAEGVPVELIVYPDQGHDLWPTAVMLQAFDKIQSFIQQHVD